MRALVLLVAALLCAPARADLFTAQLAYQKGDYERAFKDYRELAELGQATAQRNLAIMYAKGQGVRQSEINAFAWASLAAEGGDAGAKSLVEQLRPLLDPGSEKIAADIAAPFSRTALDKRLMPRVEDDELSQARCSKPNVGTLTYPLEAEEKRVQGDVLVELTVLSDGSTRNPRIVYAVPTGFFESTTRSIALHMRYQPAASDGAPVHCHLMIRFLLPGAGDSRELQRFAITTRQKAEAGDASSELLYGLMLAGLPQLGRPRSEAVPWFLKAAQAGSRSGQYMVGSSMLYGMGCRCEQNKAEVWLRRAAEADQSNAQVTLAAYALRGSADERNIRMADVWLERAAASGDHDGMYYLSALLAATPVEAIRDPKRALSLLDKLRNDVSGNPTAVEIRAAALGASGAYAEAVKKQRQAISMADALKWDLRPLNERLASYESRQAWYGDLLGL